MPCFKLWFLVTKCLSFFKIDGNSLRPSKNKSYSIKKATSDQEVAFCIAPGCLVTFCLITYVFISSAKRAKEVKNAKHAGSKCLVS